MAHLIDPPLIAPPSTVQVYVDFYDDDERELLQASLIGPLLQDFPRIVSVPTPDLCTYFLYYKKRPGILGYGDHDSVALRWRKALDEFDGQIEFSDSSIRVIQAAGMNTGTTEKIGEAVGLSVASAIHELHQADWARLPKDNDRKRLDFWHPWTASDGKQFVQVETKGATAQDNTSKAPAYDHKASIKAKKREATDEERQSSVLYGTISVLGESADSPARCWLVDPPPGVPDDPERFKTITRLQYIAEIVSFLAARSTLAASLRTRMAALNALTDIRPLDRVTLRKGTDQPFSTDTFDLNGRHNPWFLGKSVVTDGPAGGQVFLVSPQTVLFIGVREQLVVYATEQNFSDIRKYSFAPGVEPKEVECVVPVGRFQEEFAGKIAIPDDALSKSAGYARFVLKGNLQYSQSGVVVGILPVPETWRRQ